MVYSPKMKHFRFENLWIQETKCFNLIQDSWSNRDAKNIMEMINFSCLRLEEWGGGKVKELRAKIKHCRCDLRKYRSRQDGYGVQKYNKVRGEFLKLLKKQEV